MKILTFEVSDDEDQVIRSLAEKERMTISEFLRRRVTRMDRANGLPEKVLCESTGAMIFGTSTQLAPLTSKTVRHLLSDFP